MRLVHPKLDVEMSLASLYFKKDIKVLEDMPTNMISSVWKLFYSAIQTKIKLLMLLFRRNRSDAIITYEVMKANTLPVIFPIVSPNSRTRGH